MVRLPAPEVNAQRLTGCHAVTFKIRVSELLPQPHRGVELELLLRGHGGVASFGIHTRMDELQCQFLLATQNPLCSVCRESGIGEPSGQHVDVLDGNCTHMSPHPLSRKPGAGVYSGPELPCQPWDVHHAGADTLQLKRFSKRPQVVAGHEFGSVGEVMPQMREPEEAIG